MKAVKTKIICILLILSAVFSLAACDSGELPPREYDEAEVLSAARELIEKSVPFNRIYFGEGIRYLDSDGVGAYKPADTEWLAQYGVTTLEDLKNATRQVFSEKYCERVFSTVLSSVSDDDGTVVSYARYYQEVSDKGVPLRIMVLSNYDYYLENPIEYKDDITVFEVVGEIIRLRVPVILTREDGKTKETFIKVDIIEEENGWRLASDTYAIYNESTDRYDELTGGSNNN